MGHGRSVVAGSPESIKPAQQPPAVAREPKHKIDDDDEMR